MALISSTWLVEENGNTYCYWPSYLKSTLGREKAVKYHSSLMTEKCVKCLVVIKDHDVNYDNATEKLKKLEEESEQSSNTDTDIPTERFIKRSHRNSDYLYYDDEISDYEDSQGPVPPKFPQEKISKSLIQLKPVRQANSQNVFQCQAQPTKSVDLKCLSEPVISLNGSNNLPSSNPVQKCQCEKNRNILERILRDLQIIKIDVKNLTQMANTDKYSRFEALDTQLSFKTYDDLQQFENQLGEQDFFNKMLSSICLLGGKDAPDTTKKVLSLLISHELSLKINWIGANDKGSFQRLANVLKLIYAAVRRNAVCSNATNTEIEHTMKNWIKNASDREGGRANRKKKT